MIYQSSSILSFLKQTQRSLGTDSIPPTPKGLLKNDGTITSLKSNKTLDNLKSSTGNQLDRSNTETVPFPGYTMTPTSKIPEDPALMPGNSFIGSSVDGPPSTAGILIGHSLVSLVILLAIFTFLMQFHWLFACSSRIPICYLHVPFVISLVIRMLLP